MVDERGAVVGDHLLALVALHRRPVRVRHSLALRRRRRHGGARRLLRPHLPADVEAVREVAERRRRKRRECGEVGVLEQLLQDVLKTELYMGVMAASGTKPREALRPDLTDRSELGGPPLKYSKPVSGRPKTTPKDDQGSDRKCPEIRPKDGT